MKILVATDFSTRSDRALRRAVLIAGKCQASLTLVHVVDDDQPAYLIDAQRAAAAELLEQTAATIRSVDQVAADVVITTGDAFAGVLQTADELDPDLILIGPHRRQLLDIFVGTTAERTIRRSRHPVLMANGVPSVPHTRTLLAVALDDASRAAVDAVQRLGLLERTELIVLHLFDAPAIGLLKRAMEPPAALDHYVDGEEQHAEQELAAFLSKAGLAHSTRLLRPIQGSVAGMVLSCADEQGADLIVIGTNQRKGIARLLLGSVAQQVLLDAKQDVLVVPVVGVDEARAP